MPNHNEKTLACIEIEPASLAQKTIIWLHGLGADGSDFVPIVPELHLPDSLGVRFVFPDAPMMPVTINNGFEMRAWYDISTLALVGVTDKVGIAKSILHIEKLIANEVARGIATSNIILAGFSQGAVMALTAGIRHSQPLGGILALSGYFPLAEETLQIANPSHRHLPIFIAHGTEDPIVPYAMGKATYAALKQAGYPVSWHSYPIPHSVCGPEIHDISQWIQTVWR